MGVAHSACAKDSDFEHDSLILARTRALRLRYFDRMDWIFLTLIGAGAGLAGGIFGIGGGIIIIPALTVLMGYQAKTASATSLIAMIAPVGLPAVINYYQGKVIGPQNIWAGVYIALGIVAGAFFGSKLALELPDYAVRKSFAVFLAIVATYMFFKK